MFYRRENDRFFSYSEVLDFLETFFQKRIKNEEYREEMNAIIDGSRKNKTVSIRAIDVCFMNYRKVIGDFSLPTDEEMEIWKQLFNFWQ
ncbi:hypothetical protein EE896_11190 [Pantoea eucalypti]|uniref:Uncharacterized protein n=2 Tax=Pantoea eucalypti TaxID=470933 RepID=A0ABY2ZTL1_9GAMM|nr:hypothetical protein EE896_11190 [Pantoea eucalypti]TPV42709.1 hypothetical protein FJW02_02705 [Pantoea eucalypti]